MSFKLQLKERVNNRNLKTLT